MGGWVVCGQTLRQVVAQLELELLRPCQLTILLITISWHWHGRILFIIRIRFMVDEVDENRGPLVGKVKLFERNTVHYLEG